MPGIIVSRPIFNTLFKLAHEEGLSINAFLTRLLERSGDDAAQQATPAQAPEPVAARSNGHSMPESPALAGVNGADRTSAEPAATQAVSRQAIRPIEYEDETAADIDTETPASPSPRASKRKLGNSIWDKVVSMEGHRFSTSRGKKFSYRVTGEYVVVRDSSARIPRSQFDKAQKMWPVSGPSRLVGVYAPSVVWAVMNELVEAEAGEPALA